MASASCFGGIFEDFVARVLELAARLFEELELVRGSALLYVMSLARPLSTRGYRCCTISFYVYTDNSTKEEVYGTHDCAPVMVQV